MNGKETICGLLNLDERAQRAVDECLLDCRSEILESGGSWLVKVRNSAAVSRLAGQLTFESLRRAAASPIALSCAGWFAFWTVVIGLTNVHWGSPDFLETLPRGFLIAAMASAWPAVFYGVATSSSKGELPLLGVIALGWLVQLVTIVPLPMIRDIAFPASVGLSIGRASMPFVLDALIWIATTAILANQIRLEPRRVAWWAVLPVVWLGAFFVVGICAAIFVRSAGLSISPSTVAMAVRLVFQTAPVGWAWYLWSARTKSMCRSTIVR